MDRTVLKMSERGVYACVNETGKNHVYYTNSDIIYWSEDIITDSWESRLEIDLSVSIIVMVYFIKSPVCVGGCTVEEMC